MDTPTQMTQADNATHIGPNADFIGAGDDIIVLATGQTGVLVDVEGDEATIRPHDGAGLTYAPIADVAHLDSPAARSASS